MSKHTPGPWHLYERNRLCIESSSGNVALCNLARNSEDDARLISAAPDLLAAAEAAWNCIGELPPTAARVEVGHMLHLAIEKATGR